ncbi:MAG: hypothetical protein KJ718_06240 [Nanoarchaeota archaeon]|nr:hypothetical protein [Nanoarchaeota archaeon]MBU1052120.1 hypothetical protein [Nanoarchaeota archaeon]MBU1987930.1 hypothetical protein [Nanoarchaeota archaeon]
MIKFIKSSEKKKILAVLGEQYGLSSLSYLLIEGGRKKLRAFSGSLSKEEILGLGNLTNIELIGMYIISRRDQDLRINFDALSIPEIKNQISKNIIKISKQQLELWMRGHDLEIKCERGPVVLQFQDDFVGIGKSNTEKIFNYVPKERKLKTPLPIS